MKWARSGGRASTPVVVTLLGLACLSCSDSDGPTGSAGSIQVAVNTGTLSVPRSGSGSVTVTLTRAGGFNGPVTLAVTGLPAGATATINPTQLTGTTTTATIDVSAGASVALGATTATITATGQGVNQATATFQLTVTAATSVSVAYQFCEQSETPVFFAFQDGNGAWQRVTGSTVGSNTTFAFNLTQGRGGVLAVYQTASAIVARRTTTAMPMLRSKRADGFVTEVLYASAAELAADASEDCEPTEPTKTITGNVVGVAPGSYGIVSFGFTTDIFDGAVATNPRTFEVPSGPQDLVGSRVVTPGIPPDRIVVVRNLNIPDGGSLPAPIDFDGPASSVPAMANVVVSGAGAGDNLEVFVDVVTANSYVGLYSELASSPATTRPWIGLSPAVMASGDLHGLIVFASPPASPGDFRVTVKYVGAVANQTIAFGGTITAPTTSQVVGGAYPRFRFQGGLAADYNKGVVVTVSPPSGTGNLFVIMATNTYLTASGNALAYDFTMADVAGLTGFPAGARLTAGVNDLSVDAFGFTGSGMFEPTTNSLGTEFKAAVRNATLTVP